MGSFTTQICDRCNAHFPLQDVHFRDRPVRQVCWNLYGMNDTKRELCKQCRDGLNSLIKTFLESGAS